MSIAYTPLDPDVVQAFDQAQRNAIRLLRQVVEALQPGMSERDVAELARRRAGEHGFIHWFHAPEVRFGTHLRPHYRLSTRPALQPGTVVQIDLAPATDAAFGDVGTSLVFQGEEPDLVRQARELCRATVGFASRWKCVGELFVYAHAWANNHRMSLGRARAVGHVCLPPRGWVASGWPRLAHAATLIRRNQIHWFNPRRMAGLYAIRPRIVHAGEGCAFEEMVYIDKDTKRILGRDSLDEIGTI